LAYKVGCLLRSAYYGCDYRRCWIHTVMMLIVLCVKDWVNQSVQMMANLK